MDEALKNEKIELLKEFAKKEGYISVEKIISEFPDATEDFLDELEEMFSGMDVDVTKENDHIPNDDSLWDVEEPDDDLEDYFGKADLTDIDSEEELPKFGEDADIFGTEIDDINDNASQADDPVKMYLRSIGQIELLNVTQEYEYARAVQEGLMCKEKLDNAAKNGKRLSQEEIENLKEKIEQGNIARDVLIESNLRLVVSIAKKFYGRGLPFLDLIQEGNFGLIKAVSKFDPTKGYKFSTYATWWIRQSITRAIADQGRTIRIPVHMVETINKLGRVTRSLTQSKRREPTPEEIAAEMKISVEKVQQIQRIAQEPISFDSTVGEEDDSSLGDFIADTEGLNPLEYAQQQIYREEIDSVLQSLTPREEKVMRLRIGLDDNRILTLEDVGREFDVTRERIRQIQAKAIRRLRHPSRLKRLEHQRGK